MNELSNVDLVFLENVADTIPSVGEHRFSLRYRLQKRKIIRKYEKGRSVQLHRYPVKLKYAVIAVILACIAAVVGFGILKVFDGFRVTDYDIYSMLYINDEVNLAPKTIEKKFNIDTDISGYSAQTICDDETQYWIKYEKSGFSFSVNQNTVNSCSTIMINTENALEDLVEVNINGWKGVYYQTFSGAHTYVFNANDYIVMYCGNIDRSELENVIKTTKFE